MGDQDQDNKNSEEKIKNKLHEKFKEIYNNVYGDMKTELGNMVNHVKEKLEKPINEENVMEYLFGDIKYAEKGISCNNNDDPKALELEISNVQVNNNKIEENKNENENDSKTQYIRKLEGL